MGRSRALVSSEVDRMFDVLWSAFLEVVEEPAVYEKEVPPVMTEQVLESIQSEMSTELHWKLYERVRGKICVAGFGITSYFTSYIVNGGLPTERSFEDDYSDLIEMCDEAKDMHEHFSCVRELYECITLAMHFFKHLPSILVVETVTAPLAPKVCEAGKLTVPLEELAGMVDWAMCWQYPWGYEVSSGRVWSECWYGLRDTRVLRVMLKSGSGLVCGESFGEEAIRVLETMLELVEGMTGAPRELQVYGQVPVRLPRIPARVVDKPKPS